MNQTELIPTCRFAVQGDDGGLLCHCARVKEDTVHRAVREGVVDSVESVMVETGAGTGCRACHCRIRRVLSGLPAQCGGRFDRCHGCGCISALCECEAA